MKYLYTLIFFTSLYVLNASAAGIELSENKYDQYGVGSSASDEVLNGEYPSTKSGIPEALTKKRQEDRKARLEEKDEDDFKAGRQ